MSFDTSYWPQWRMAIAILAWLMAPPAIAHTPPEGDERLILESLPDAAERIQRMNRFETARTGYGLKQKAVFKMTRALLEAAGLPRNEQALALYRGPSRAFPYAAKPELRSTGKVRALTVLVDFSDKKAAALLPGMTPERISQNIYAAGTADAQAFVPYESLRSYYWRASEEKLTIEGDVIGWVHLPRKRTSYEPSYPPGADEELKARIDNQALFDLFTEALDTVASNTDFAQYDNDNDGDIDFLTVMYAGPDNGWGGFWWAYRWEFFVQDASKKTYGGKRLKQFVFQFVSKRSGGDFDPKTLIHETGHALGLPDYYDYCPTSQFDRHLCSSSVTNPGPDGGLGGLDIMDSNVTNQNAFSRWLLDWIEPTIVRKGMSTTFTLAASGAKPGGTKALAIFPDLGVTNAPGQELFMVENRARVGNDGGLAETPGDGLLIWHIDGTPRGANDDFDYDNSYTSHKLIKLVRAKSASDFGEGESADALDYFDSGKEFTPNSSPSSVGYDNRRTNVSLTNIVRKADTVSVSVTISGNEEDVAVSSSAPLTGGAPKQDQMSRRFGSTMASPPKPAIDQETLDQLDSEFSGAKASELSQLWESSRMLVDPSAALTESVVLSELLLTHWAAKDGRAAAEALIATADSEFRRQMFPRVMEAWAISDPGSANDWYFASERAGVRADNTLQAGEQFTRALFRWRGASTPTTAASAIDLIQGGPELFGAVAGLRAAASVDAVDAQLKQLSTRSDEALAVQKLQSAIEDVSRQLKTSDRPNRSEVYVHDRLRDLGIVDR